MMQLPDLTCSEFSSLSVGIVLCFFLHVCVICLLLRDWESYELVLSG